VQKVHVEEKLHRADGKVQRQTAFSTSTMKSAGSDVDTVKGENSNEECDESVIQGLSSPNLLRAGQIPGHNGSNGDKGTKKKKRSKARKPSSQDASSTNSRFSESSSFNSLMTRNTIKRRLSPAVLKKNMRHALSERDIFGESSFRDRMREEYPITTFILATFFQGLFFLCMSAMFVFFCIRVSKGSTEHQVSRERLLWYGYDQLPDIAVLIQDYHGTKKHFSVRAQKKYIEGIDYGGRFKQDINTTKCDLQLNGDEVAEGAHCFPTSGDDLVVGQTFGQAKYRYVEISILADKWPIPEGTVSLYVKNYVDMNNYIWDSLFYDINSGFFSMAVELFFTKVTARNFLHDVVGVSSNAGVEDLAQKRTKYMKFERSYQRMKPFDVNNTDPAEDEIEVMSFYLRSSLYVDDEKYTRYTVTNLLEDIGGLSASVLVVFGIIFTVSLCCLDQIGAHTFNRHASPQKGSGRENAEEDSAVLEVASECDKRSDGSAFEKRSGGSENERM